MTNISQFDVLCGKDKTYESHAGNRFYRDMIVAVAPLYAATTSKQDKMRMTSDIVSKIIMEHGSRFLKLSSVHGEWEEINIAAARDKTSHALRFCAAHLLPAANASSSSSSSSLLKRGSKSKAKRKPVVSPTGRKRLRRKVSFDEGMKKNKCVSPEPPTSRSYEASSYPSQAQEPIPYQYFNNHDDLNFSMTTWRVPDMTKSIHNLSNDCTVVYYQPPSQYSTKTIVPWMTASNADIDTLLSYPLEDEFGMPFEY